MENISKEIQSDNGADRVFHIYGLSNGGNEAQCCVHIISVHIHVPRIIRRKKQEVCLTEFWKLFEHCSNIM